MKMILVVKKKWGNEIFRCGKDWEIRGCSTKKRGIVRIAVSGTGLVIGEVTLCNVLPLTREIWETNKKHHHVNMTWDELIKIYKKPYAWVMTEQHEYTVPKKYYHPRGAVIWIKEQND